MYCPGLLLLDPLLMSVTRQVVPLPLVVVVEPFAALALYWKVMLVIGTPTVSSAPSTLGVSVLEELEPLLGVVVVSQI